jgi:hypothetical protein
MIHTLSDSDVVDTAGAVDHIIDLDEIVIVVFTLADTAEVGLINPLIINHVDNTLSLIVVVLFLL